MTAIQMNTTWTTFYYPDSHQLGPHDTKPSPPSHGPRRELIMEGILLIPPDRGTIIGRALWKPRCVVIGDARRRPQQSQSSSALSQGFNNRSQSSRAGGSREPPSSIDLPERAYLSIYKSKNDSEPVQQHAISSLIDCQVQMVAHRKQGHVLPTLVINAAPDPAAEKLRKRRSSRTGGLSNSKDNGNTTLWFRPGDDVHSLQDWSSCIQSLMQAARSNPLSPLSPATPGSPTFINPFAVSRSTTGASSINTTRESSSDYYSRPGSGNPNQRSALNHKPSAQYSTREQPSGFSEAPSLRSRRSDLSHSSSMNPAAMGFTMGHGFNSGHPADLPSPAPTLGGYQGEFIEGWTSAQGRSSTLSSPIRGRDSVSSQPPVPQPTILNSSSPPMPRETILDRAFQLRCIPGSEQEIPGEDKLSSIARFDALMREVDAKRKTSVAEMKPIPNEGLKSAWDLDEESEEDSDDEPHFDDDVDGDRIGNPVFMPPTAQRALDFISSRHTSPRPSRVQSPVNGMDFATENFRAMNSGYHGPRADFPRDRPTMAQRTHSQPQLADHSHQTAPTALEVPSASASAKSLEEAKSGRTSTSEKRLSSSSTKRLSFTEFTKRLSSTSSLLMIQTNNSGGASSRGSSELDGPTAATPKGGSMRLRGVTSPGPGRERCIRGSVLGEGGFL